MIFLLISIWSKFILEASTLKFNENQNTAIISVYALNCETYHLFDDHPIISNSACSNDVSDEWIARILRWHSAP